MLVVDKIVKESHSNSLDSLELRFYGTEDEFEKVLDFVTVRSKNLSVKCAREGRDYDLWLDNGKNYKVVYNMPATILFVGNEKYVSKAHLEDFDKEKGLLMCLAKANGISHLQLKRMIKNAEDQREKVESYNNTNI